MNAEGVDFPLTLNLNHSGTRVTGSVSDANRYAVGISGSTAAAAGSEEGSRDITLVIRFSDGQVLTCTGVVDGNNKGMAGRYTSHWGTGDSWTAKRR